MDLFSPILPLNLLPYEGVSEYYGSVLDKNTADSYFFRLLREVPWKNDEAIIFGKHIVTKRKVAWFGDSDYKYAYSNTTKTALSWTRDLSELKTIVESLSNAKFNSCLLNLYHSGEEGMAWHSDDEKALGKNSAIASLSLGAERRFLFRHKKTKEQVSILLESGSLLLMREETQDKWLHSLPKAKKILTPRINLTFRTMIPQERNP